MVIVFDCVPVNAWLKVVPSQFPPIETVLQ